MTGDVSFEPLLSIRTWEYETDEIRLSAMSNSRFVDHIQQVFHFDRAAIDRPTHRDRGSRAVWPPGLVFELGVGPVGMGTVEGDEAEEVAFRKLTIEADRISIEVAGKTTYADQLMTYLRFLLSEIHTPEGFPFIGEPAGFRDFSIVVMRNATGIVSRMLPTPVSESFAEFPGSDAGNALIPEISLRMQPESLPVALNSRAQWTLKPRFGVRPSRGVFESHADLVSDDHISMLRKIVERLEV